MKKIENQEVFEILNSLKNFTKIYKKPPDVLYRVQVGGQNVDGCFRQTCFVFSL